MMFQSSSMSHAAGQGYQAAELKYDGGELSMVVIVPDTGAFANFEDNLDGAKLEQIISSLKNNTVNLTMPKFEFDSEFGLNAALETLGMKNAFNPDLADFSGMTGQRDLYISDVVHKAFVAVDEFGTEAAAATGVVVGTTSMPLDPATVVLDRPFIFLIRDIATGAVIFIGRVMNPLA
jgi:serpin B